MFTRVQYIDHECSHRDYYGQFVTPRAENYVARMIGANRLRESKDPHMNDIPLHLWDELDMRETFGHDLWRKANGHDDSKTYPWSMSANVCLAKQAAYAWLERND